MSSMAGGTKYAFSKCSLLFSYRDFRLKFLSALKVGQTWQTDEGKQYISVSYSP